MSWSYEISTSELPGVYAVLSGEDVRDLRGGNIYVDEPLLASWDRVRFIGDKVAAIAAEDEDTALRALNLIEVEYEELPAVFGMCMNTTVSSPGSAKRLDIVGLADSPVPIDQPKRSTIAR